MGLLLVSAIKCGYKKAKNISVQTRFFYFWFRWYCMLIALSHIFADCDGECPVSINIASVQILSCIILGHPCHACFVQWPGKWEQTRQANNWNKFSFSVQILGHTWSRAPENAWYKNSRICGKGRVKKNGKIIHILWINVLTPPPYPHRPR